MTANAGARTLLRLALRRDRVMIPVWVGLLFVLALTVLTGYQGLYSEEAERREFAAGINTNTSLLAFYGPAHAASVGALTAWRLGAAAAVLVSVMSILLVVRHTRAEEEDGRLELVSAGVVGRYAPLTVALGTAFLANLALGLSVTLLLMGEGAAGAVAFGLAWTLTGTFFATVAAVTAQLTGNARVANTIAITLLGAAFLLRAVADSGGANGPTWLSWLSPIGWGQQVRPYAGDRWWVLALPLAGAMLLAALAYSLVARRDLGGGLLPSRPGPAQAAPSLRSPLALAWRLQRGALAAWAAGFAVYGLVFGGTIEGVDELAGDSPSTRDAIARMGGTTDLTNAFLVTAFGLMALTASVYAVQAMLRLRGEEAHGRAEPLLASPVSRVRWAGGHALIALLGTALLLVVGGVTTGLTYGLTSGDLAGAMADAMGGALVQVPAAWVPAGIALALLGPAPRAVAGAWAAIAVFLLLGQVGPLLELDQWAMDLSPFTHVPKLPGAAMAVAPMVWLAVVTAALAAAGLYGLRRRDITA
ncbi:ABC-2 type transport system permease protein [Thermomonospora echinospora]|uniref:ABC-2 type transport system permease protein n=1 Tax=Thermomonospora echinospora TaxID=1992 RepID=A0A1H6E4E1_9ACTN|nr:ABC transporter permease [Thermomonospora echinospora]SEG92512.1 ABC-2 type transport system permease protein [Thermomonospora echinospora]